MNDVLYYKYGTLLLNHLITNLINLNLCTDHCLMFTLPIGIVYGHPDAF